jgi:hypothetical protein
MQENVKAKYKTQCSIGDTQIKTPDDTTRQGNDPQSIGRFETILHSSLTGLFEELGRSDWYIREHEIVNLFTFGYLVPEFQAHGLDFTMIGIDPGDASGRHREIAIRGPEGSSHLAGATDNPVEGL